MGTEQRLAVLVVDDESAVRRTLAAMVAGLGYAALSAAGGAQAVEACRAGRVEIVAAVLDVRMPGLDGPATLDALRALDPALPCVFVTGDTGPYTADELLARGAAAVLSKPVDLATLGAALAGSIASASTPAGG